MMKLLEYIFSPITFTSEILLINEMVAEHTEVRTTSRHDYNNCVIIYQMIAVLL